jgi:hypothetical protein
MKGIITFWQNQFPDHLANEIETVYGNLAAAKVAHSERLKASVPTPDIEEKMRSDEALTMSLLGCIAEDAVLSTRLGGKYRKKRSA